MGAQPPKAQRHPILARLEENDYDFSGQSLDYEPNLEFDDTDLMKNHEEQEQEFLHSQEEMSTKLLLMRLNSSSDSSSSAKQDMRQQHEDTNDDHQITSTKSSSLARHDLVYSSTSHTSSNASSNTNETTGSQLGPAPAAQSNQQAVEESHYDESQLDDDSSMLQDDESRLHEQICSQMLKYDAYLESPSDLLEENFEEAFKSGLFEQASTITSDNKFHFSNKTPNSHSTKKKHHHRHSSKSNNNNKTNSSIKRTDHDHDHKANCNINKQPINNKQSASRSQRLNAFFKSATGAIYGHSNKQQRKNNNTNLQAPDLSSSSSACSSCDSSDSSCEEPVGPIDWLTELNNPDFLANDDFSDIARHNCVEVAGDDHLGRRIITIYACRLPADSNRLHHLRLLKYIMFTLNQFVDNDYVLVYFHVGLNSRNKPKLSFLYQAYRAFDRRYKKNLKALFLVHPTNFIRIVWQLFKPVISIKFGRKMRYVNYLNELEQYMHLEQLLIPKQVLE